MKLKNLLLVVLESATAQKLFVILYTAVIVCLSLFPLGLDSKHFGVALTDTPETLSNTFGYADAGSYLKAALELNTLDRLTQNQHWVINLWPPGMVWLDAAFLRIAGGGFAVVVATVTFAVWTGLASVFALKVRQSLGTVFAILAVTLLLISSPLQTWMFDSGLFYAEGISIAAFLLGLILLLRGVESDDPMRIVAHGIGSGCFLAVAAYFRSTFSTIETGLLLFTLAAGAVLLVGRYRKLGSSLQNPLNKRFTLLATAWFTMFTLMEPWLQFTAESIRNVRAWSVVGAGFIRNAWVERSSAPDFMKAGGVGWGCEIDPGFCQEVTAFEAASDAPYPLVQIIAQTVKTAVFNPFEYLGDRLHFISIGWFSTETSMGTLSLVWGLVTLIGFLVTFVVLARRAFKGNVAAAFVLLACGLLMVPEMVGHVEPRYFIPLKLLFVVLPWVRGLEKEKDSLVLS